MLIPSWRRWLGSPSSPRPAKARKAGRMLTAVEQCEARQLLAVLIPAPATLRLAPASDTGPSGSGNFTSSSQPTFVGTAQPFSVVNVDVVQGGNEVPIGSTTAGPTGAYSITSGPLLDGTYRIRAVATSLGFTSPGGNPFPPQSVSAFQSLTVQAAGPRVAAVQFEPLTGRVLVRLTGDLAGIDRARLTNPANYSFKPVAVTDQGPSVDPSRPRVDVILVPRYVVTGVSLVPNPRPGLPQTMIVSINNNQPIRAGFYRFTINSAAIVDNAGNALDGEYSGVFPTGNGQPGGNFVANLAVLKASVQPALPVTNSSNSLPDAAKPPRVFVPTTRQTLTKYIGNNNPDSRLKGGSNVFIIAQGHQFFPGTYRLPETVGGNKIRPVKNPARRLR